MSSFSEAEYEPAGRRFTSHKVVCWFEPVPQQGPWHYPWILVSVREEDIYYVAPVVPMGEP